MTHLSAPQLHILQHALGIDSYGLGRSYRNHYVCGPGHDGFDNCRELVGLGLMVEHSPREIFGGDSCFCVTDQGRAVVQSDSPPAPKLTRSQRRYRNYIASGCGFSFGEWLRMGAPFGSCVVERVGGGK